MFFKKKAILTETNKLCSNIFQLKRPAIFVNNRGCGFYHVFMSTIIPPKKHISNVVWPQPSLVVGFITTKLGYGFRNGNGFVISKCGLEGGKFFVDNHGMGIEFFLLAGKAK